MTTISEIIAKEKLILIDFSAEWCGPCKMMAPVLKELKKNIGNKASILKIDVDKNPSTADSFQIQGVPTLILFKNSQQVWRQSGVVSAKQLEQVINQNQ